MQSIIMERPHCLFCLYKTEQWMVTFRFLELGWQYCIQVSCYVGIHTIRSLLGPPLSLYFHVNSTCFSHTGPSWSIMSQEIHFWNGVKSCFVAMFFLVLPSGRDVYYVDGISVVCAPVSSGCGLPHLCGRDKKNAMTHNTKRTLWL
jgi:hypothetical protein